MSPQFDIRWLSLSVDSSDGLDEAVAAEERPLETVTDGGRFEALLNSHIRWATSASAGNKGDAQIDEGLSDATALPAGQAVTDIPGDLVRSTRIAREVSEQLARIAMVGVAA